MGYSSFDPAVQFRKVVPHAPPERALRTLENFDTFILISQSVTHLQGQIDDPARPLSHPYADTANSSPAMTTNGEAACGRSGTEPRRNTRIRARRLGDALENRT